MHVVLFPLTGFVRELIGKKKVFEAVRLIFAFKLNKFSPVELLKDYLEYAKKTRKNERSIAKKVWIPSHLLVCQNMLLSVCLIMFSLK